MVGGGFGLGVRIYRFLEWHLPPSLFAPISGLRLRMFKAPKRKIPSRKDVTVERIDESSWRISGPVFDQDCGYQIRVSGKGWYRNIDIDDLEEDRFSSTISVISGYKLRFYLSTKEYNPAMDRCVYLGKIGPNTGLRLRYADQAGMECHIGVSDPSESSIPTEVPAVLFIHHVWRGGSTNYLNAKVSEIIEKGGVAMVASEDDGTFSLRCSYRDSTEIWLFDSMDAMFDGVSRFAVSEAVVNEATSFSDPQALLDRLVFLKRDMGVKLIHLLHDYHCICPSFLLLDNSDRFCRPCSDTGKCRECFDRNPNKVISFSSEDEWRRMWGYFLRECEEVRAFSDSSLSIMGSVYGKMGNETLVPHTVKDMRKVDRQKCSDGLTVAVLGDMMKQKGSEIIREMCRSSASEGITLIHYGMTYCEPIAGLVEKGPYRRDELPDLMENDGVDIVLIPSVWPETFSYTAEEAMQMGMPLAVFDIGAPAERVKGYDAGMIIPEMSAESAIGTLLSMKGL